MEWRLFRALDQEWCVITRTGASAAATRRWADDPTLQLFPSPAVVVESLRGAAADPAGADRVLLSLARRAASDDFAMRTMLQALVPGLVNVMKRLARNGSDEELEAQVLTEAVHRIRHYPCDRRPRSVAANVTLDVLGTVVRSRARARGAAAQLERDGGRGAGVPERDPSLEVLELVEMARAGGRLSDGDARLVLSVAVGTDTLKRRAEREGVSYGAMSERWRRARDRLRWAVVSDRAGHPR